MKTKESVNKNKNKWTKRDELTRQYSGVCLAFFLLRCKPGQRENHPFIFLTPFIFLAFSPPSLLHSALTDDGVERGAIRVGVEKGKEWLSMRHGSSVAAGKERVLPFPIRKS